jgi:DNA replication protein DnaC
MKRYTKVHRNINLTGETAVGKGEHIYLALNRSAIKMQNRNVLYVFLKDGHNIWKNSETD